MVVQSPVSSEPVRITETSARKTATARRRDGVIHINLPERWSAPYKVKVANILIERVLRSEALERRQLEQWVTADVPKITIENLVQLRDFVQKVNEETFQVPVQGVRIGTAKYTRLAQVNLDTSIITVSRYCLNDVPVPALRYLIIHELAHFYERGHGPRFWAHVARFSPDYERQAQIMKAIHSREVLLRDGVAVPATTYH